MVDCSRLGRVALASMAMGLAMSSGVLAADGEMNLESAGVFWAGGELVDRTQPEQKANKVLRNQAYVEYFVPKGVARDAVPIILTHTALSGAVFRTTPDGREGWAEYFLRRGHPVFVVDPPGTGRAGFEIDDINMAAKGQTPPVTADPLIRSDSSAWPRWNLGPEFGKVPQGSATPNSEDAIKHFMGVLVPGRIPPNSVMDPTFIAVLERVNKMHGPAIFVGWSTAGGLAQRLAVARPELLRALVLVDAYNGQLPLPTAQNWFDYCGLNPAKPIVDVLVGKKIPILAINSQYGHIINTGRAKEVCKGLVDQVKAEGGNATGVYLPDVGISGNSHMMFWDKNSDDVAKVINGWIQTALKK